MLISVYFIIVAHPKLEKNISPSAVTCRVGH